MKNKEILKRLKIRHCLRCNHVWVSNKKLIGKLPIFCPLCKSPYWNKQRIKDLKKLSDNSLQKFLITRK